MTLEEAIQRCEEVANSKCDSCAEHRQLAKWLKELKYRRETEGRIKEQELALRKFMMGR